MNKGFSIVPDAKYTACIMHRVVIIRSMVLKYGFLGSVAESNDVDKSLPVSIFISKPLNGEINVVSVHKLLGL